MAGEVHRPTTTRLSNVNNLEISISMRLWSNVSHLQSAFLIRNITTLFDTNGAGWITQYCCVFRPHHVMHICCTRSGPLFWQSISLFLLRSIWRSKHLLATTNSAQDMKYHMKHGLQQMLEAHLTLSASPKKMKKYMICLDCIAQRPMVIWTL